MPERGEEVMRPPTAVAGLSTCRPGRGHAGAGRRKAHIKPLAWLKTAAWHPFLLGACLFLALQAGTAASAEQQKSTEWIPYDLRLAGAWHGAFWGVLLQINCTPTKNPFVLSCVGVAMQPKNEWKGSPVIWTKFSGRALRSGAFTYYKLSMEQFSPFVDADDKRSIVFAAFEFSKSGEVQARFADRDFLVKLARRGEIPAQGVGKDAEPDLKRVDLSRVIAKHGVKQVFPQAVGPFYPTRRDQKPAAVSP